MSEAAMPPPAPRFSGRLVSASTTTTFSGLQPVHRARHQLADGHVFLLRQAVRGAA